MSGRSAQLLREATALCGSLRDDGLVELAWSQRRLAAELGISVRTLQYHLRRAADLVVATTPRLVLVAPAGEHTTLRLVADDDTVEQAPTGAATPGAATPGAATPGDRLALAVALVSLTDRLVRVIERLLDDDTIEEATAGPVATGGARSSERAGSCAPDRAAPVVELARRRTVSQSGSSPTDGLTATEARAARDPGARGPRAGAARGEPDADSLIGTEDLDRVLRPLEELCRRVNLPGVDAAGRTRVARFDLDQVQLAVTHVIASIRSGATVRRPFGLLISELDAGRHRPGLTRSRPDDARAEDPTGPEPLVEAVALADWSDADIDELFDTEIRPDLPALLRGVPAPMRRALVAERLAESIGSLPTVRPGSGQ